MEWIRKCYKNSHDFHSSFKSVKINLFLFKIKRLLITNWMHFMSFFSVRSVKTYFFFTEKNACQMNDIKKCISFSSSQVYQHTICSNFIFIIIKKCMSLIACSQICQKKYSNSISQPHLSNSFSIIDHAAKYAKKSFWILEKSFRGLTRFEWSE